MKTCITSYLLSSAQKYVNALRNRNYRLGLLEAAQNAVKEAEQELQNAKEQVRTDSAILVDQADFTRNLLVEGLLVRLDYQSSIGDFDVTVEEIEAGSLAVAALSGYLEK